MKLILTTCSIVAFFGLLRAQFTSLTASADFVTNPPNTFGLDSTALSVEILQVRITPNDINYVGRINVLVYDSISESPMSMISISRAEILTGSPIENGDVIFNFPWLNHSMTYKLVVESQNFQLGYLSPLTLYFRED